MRRSAQAPTSPSLAAIIRYILFEDKWFKEFALAYTNIATIIEDGFVDAEDGDGIFSGFQPASASYVQDSWQYKGEMLPPAIAEHYVHVQDESKERAAELTKHPPPSDPTLQHPNCVYQIMRRHYARYTPDMVEHVTGCPQESFLRICEALTHNSGRERTGAFCYAVGWTHHASGVQIIRAAAIIQGLLGNIGRPGGGVLALRGHCSIQGSTDIPTLYNMLPTYLPQPNAFNPAHHAWPNSWTTETVPTGWWNNLPKYMVSLLKAWYGDHAQQDNEFGYKFLPKLIGDHSQLPMTLAMVDGVVKGQFVLGQNPVVGAVNSELVQRGHGQAGMAGGARLRDDRDGEFLAEGRPRAELASSRRSRSAPKSSSVALRNGGGEGRHADKHDAAGSVARQGM